MPPSPGPDGATEPADIMKERQRAPSITIHSVEDKSHPNHRQPNRLFVDQEGNVRPKTGDPGRRCHFAASFSPQKSSLSGRLEMPDRNGLNGLNVDFSPVTTVSPGCSVSGSRSVSSCTTFPDNMQSDLRRLSQASISGHPFSLSLATLTDIVASKSISKLLALGGLDGLAYGLQTDLQAGICSETWQSNNGNSFDAGNDKPHSKRREIYGTNRLAVKKVKGIFELMLNALSDKVLIFLCVVAGISLVLGLYQSFLQPHLAAQPQTEWVDSVTIVVAVLIVVVTGAVNDYQKEKQFASLMRKTEDRAARAIRSGKPSEISIFDIVVCDILQMTPGSLVPADGILITGFSVRCDESPITGESEHLTKLPLSIALSRLSAGGSTEYLDPFMISGSKVIEGTGTYLVTGVGVNSIHGRLKMGLTEPTTTTPLQAKLSIIADKIAIAGVTAAVLLFLILTVKVIVQLWGSGTPAVEVVQIFLRILMTSMSLVVVAVPEGLPLAVTLALAIGVTRMLKDNNLVRVLSACETMGNATIVCSDKTGTLTMNKMTVTAGFFGLNTSFRDVEHDDFPDHLANGTTEDDSSLRSTSLPEFRESLHPEIRDVLLKSITANTTALEKHESSIFIGSSTETALLEFSRKWLGMGPLQEERANICVEHIYPFDSCRKYMATVTKTDIGTYRIYVKGAAEILLSCCKRVIKCPDVPLEEDLFLTSDVAQSILNFIQEYGKMSLRTIGLAYRDVSSWPPVESPNPEEALQHTVCNMTFLGFLGIQDPLRPDVCHAVAQCTKAGVSVKMVTGDNLHTAQAIARKCGILTESGLVMEGPEFRKLSGPEMYHVLPRLKVLARSSPEDKNIIVKRFKELGETVAVTGDGTNDGLALRTADVGFSMGISGTDVAREASSIVLMDDKFSSIVRAIEWGRSVSDAVKKFLHFQLTVNITAVALTFISSIDSETGKSIMSPAQLLWVNLIMDTLAALALATDPPSPHILDRTPDTKMTPLISPIGWKMIIGQAIYQLVVMLLLNFKGQGFLEYIGLGETPTLETFVFNAFVWMQIFNLYNNRRLDNNLNVFEGIHRNFFFIAVNTFIIAGQVLIVTIGGNALSTVPLSASEWIVSVGLGAICMPVAILIRLISQDMSLDAFCPSILGRKYYDLQGAAWFSTVDRVRHELMIRSPHQPRSSRIRHLFQNMVSSWRNLPDDTSDSLGNERSSLLGQEHRYENFRTSSACASSVVMAGMVAGGVGGWPQREDD